MAPVVLAAAVTLGACAGTGGETPGSPRPTQTDRPSPTPTTPPDTPPASPSPSTEPTPSGTPAPTIQIRVGAEGAISAPPALAPRGYVFEVAAAAPAMITLLAPVEGYTPEQFAQDVGDQASYEAHIAADARFRASARAVGGAYADAETTAGFAAVLEAGTYWLVDLAQPPTPEDVVQIEVSGPAVQTDLPEPDAVAIANDDLTWTLPDRIPASGVMLLRNGTTLPHQLILFGTEDRESAENLAGLVRLGLGVEGVGNGPAAVGPGSEFLWFYRLEPGGYVVMDRAVGSLLYTQYVGAEAYAITVG